MLNKRYHRFGVQYCILCGVLFAIGGCSSGTNPPPSSQPAQPTGTYNYALDITNLRPLDTTTGQYVLWMKFAGDSSWHHQTLNFWTRPAGSLKFAGQIQLPSAPDSIRSVEVSVEPMIVPANPSSLLLRGVFQQDSANLTSAVGDYSGARANVIFATRSSDTDRGRQEFYLMRLMNGIPESSTANLPRPPDGWDYGLWVLDSNFYPQHKFFYGWFLNADSASSRWQPGNYPFPGGFDPAPLNDPGARLEVTLEPTFAVMGNHPSGPSPFTILWAQLRRYIAMGDTLPLQNSWPSTDPEGKLTISQQ